MGPASSARTWRTLCSGAVIDVTVLDDLSGGFRENVPAGAAFVHGSIADAALVDRLCSRGRFTHVYHLAAYAAEGLSHFIKRFNYTNNVIGSVNLLNAAVNTGVGDVRLHLVDRRLRRAARAADDGGRRRPHPGGLVRHRQIRRRARAARLPRDVRARLTSIFRPHNVFGPRQNIGDRYRNVIGIFMNQILQGQPMTIFGDGTQTRAFSYIDDVAPMHGGGDRRAGSAEPGVQRRRRPALLAERAGAPVAAAMGVPPDIVHLPRATRGAARARRRTTRCGACSASAADDAGRGAGADGGVGRGSTARAPSAPFDGDRDHRGTCRPSWRTLMTRYHAAHLTEDPARASSGGTVAEYLSTRRAAARRPCSRSAPATATGSTTSARHGGSRSISGPSCRASQATASSRWSSISRRELLSLGARIL